LSFQEFSQQVDGSDGSAPVAPGQNVVYAPKKPTYSSGADEVEEDGNDESLFINFISMVINCFCCCQDFITEKERIVLPSAPRASRGPAYDDQEIPREPPFQVGIWV